MLDNWGFLTILLKHVLSTYTGLQTQYLPKYWFSGLAIRYVFKTEQHSIWNELSEFYKSAASGDEVVSAAVTRNLAPSAECRQGLLVLPLASSHCG